MSGVICDKRIGAKMKGKVYKRVVSPAILFGFETVALPDKTRSRAGGGRVKMLRFSMEVTWMDRNRNVHIKETAQVGCLGDKVRGQIEIVWTFAEEVQQMYW